MWMLFAIVFAGLSGNRAYGQLPMTRSVFTAAYTPITTLGGASTSTIPGASDDGTQTLIPIGFTFNYLGTNYTTVDACANGWISFGAAGANAWTNSGLFSATTPNLTLAAWWDDLNTGTGSILYQTQGTPGSQTFTIQWTDVLSYNGSARTLHFQIILFEGTNVIEFRYGTLGAGAFSTSESASIGIEGATGGAGNFLDAVSGSAFINQSFMTSHKWPAAHIRFTPGAPTAIPGGTYTVGLAGTYPNISEAFANINHRGITGPVTLSLIDATYDTTLTGGRNTFPLMMGPVAGNSAVNTITMQPASGNSTLSYRGVASGNGGNQTNSTVFGTGNEPILAFVGTDYVTVRNLNLVSTGSTASNIVDRGLVVANATATDGAQNGLYENITVTLLRNNTSSIGIQQLSATTATSAAGANSTNIYRNLNISNVYAGIYLLGTAAFPDLACQIGNTSPTAFNTIGGLTAFDIGGGNVATQNFGIRIASQSGAKVFNNLVRNVSAQTTTDGILCELGQGTSEIYMNKVQTVRNNGTASTSFASGIRANLATTGTHSLRVYNNFVADITSAYTGAATATRIVKGIYVQSAGSGVSTESINVDANNVRIDGTLFPNSSNACFEIGTASGPVINVRNNVFANYTGAQAGVATHNAWFSTSATATGNTGSVSNYNDLYIANATNGFTGTGNATTYATLANWQAGMVGMDANSVVTDPTFISATDLHVTGSGINNVGNLTGSPWVTVDIDNAARSLGTPDIGADEFAPSTIDMQATALNSPLTTGCYSASTPVNVTIKNNAPITIDFSVNPTTVTVNVTGAITTTLTVVVNSGTLAAGATQAVAMGNVNMSTLGTYTFNGFTSVTGDGVTVNDAFTAVNITISAGTVTSSVNTLCVGGSVVLTVTGQNGTIQWQGSTDGGTTWVNETGTGNTASPYTASPTDTTLYRVLLCGTFASNTVNVLANPLVTPTVVNDTICGQGTVTLQAAGAPTINWYSGPSGGSPLATGGTYSPTVTTTTTYYAEAINGGTISAVGLANIAAGGAQQSSTNYQIFDVLSNTTLMGVYVYPGAVGIAKLEWRTSAGVLLQASTLTVGPGDVGNRTYFPLGWNLVPGTAYRLQQDITGVSMFRVSTGTLPYPYTIPGVISITGSAAGNTFWYWGFDWQILTGCPGPRVPVTATVTPAPSVSIAVSNSISCSGDPVEMIVSSTNPTYSYAWTPGTGLNSTTNDTVISTPSATTTYIVNASDSISGCLAADTVVVNYIPKPVPIATVTPDTICAGDSIALATVTNPLNFQVGTGTIANSSTGYPAPFGNFYWGSRHQMLILASELQAQNIGPGFLNAMSFDVTSLNAAVPHDNFEIKLALTNATDITVFQSPTFTSVFTAPSYLPAVGVVAIPFSTNFYWDGSSNIIVETCHNNAAYADNVSVNQSTTGFNSTVYYRADAAGVCGNNAVTGFNAQRPNMYFWMLGSYSYDWSPNATLATPTAANTVGIANGSTNFIVSVTDTLSGCVGVDTAYVFANPLPVINLGNDGYFCGTSTTLDAGNAGANYVWSTLDSTQTIFVNTNGSYNVQVTDTLGCSNSDTVAITFTPFPVVNLGADTTTCQGNTITLDAGIPGSSYNWSTSDSTQTIAVTTTGSYSVVLTDTAGCTGSDTVNVTINALPTVTASAASDTICNTNNTPVTLTGSPSGGTFTGTGVTGNQFSAPTAGPGLQTITYSFTDGNGCSNTATVSIFVDVCASVADGFNGFNVGLYPNPNDGRFTFTVALNADAEVSYEVADARGVVVLRDNSDQPSGLYKQSVNLNDFATGVYTLRVTVDGVTAHKRLVVQR
ncbi:MAG: T9SS type A sorting domain-containing protein [Bacteroidetes bacterium]|nr:T9SS type A sorting domain-containing protein [Bacteroidota bacterium]